MKFEIAVREICLDNGINNAYQLQKKANLAPSTAARLFNNKVTVITLETLEKLCDAFDCEAGAFFKPKQ